MHRRSWSRRQRASLAWSKSTDGQRDVLDTIWTSGLVGDGSDRLGVSYKFCCIDHVLLLTLGLLSIFSRRWKLWTGVVSLVCSVTVVARVASSVSSEGQQCLGGG